MISSTIVQNPLYARNLKKWQLVEDVVEGQQAVKDAGDAYLPRINPDDTSPENRKRYEQYLLRALFYNVCFRTLNAMVGVAFRINPAIELPVGVEYLEGNASGSGLSLNQQAQETLAEVIKKGRCGMLVDFPAVDGEVSQADVERGVRASIKLYNAEYCIDWNEETTLTGTRLNYVKLMEVCSRIDIVTGARESSIEYIVLRLMDGVYSFERTCENGNRLSHSEPRDANGNRLNHIPFLFCGSQDNTPSIDQALLYDLAEVNISHYRNSADNEEASFIAGQPTLGVTSSLSASDWKEQNPNGVQIGARKGHFLGESGSLSMIQAEASNLPRENMKDKVEYMVSLGAQLVTQSSNETAFTTGVNLATNTSALALAVGNVSDAYVAAIGWCLEFMSGTDTDEPVYSINKDFFPATMDAQSLTAWVAAVQGGTVPKSIFYNQLRDAGLTELDDEAIDTEIETDPAGLDLGTA